MGSVFITFFRRVDDFFGGGITQINASYETTRSAGTLGASLRGTKAELDATEASVPGCSIGSVMLDTGAVGVLFCMAGEV